MPNLRTIGADGSSSAQTADYFGRIPETVLSDIALSLGARLTYATITLLMARNQHPTLCMDSMREIGRAMGASISETRKRIAELEARGHVERERVRTIAGAPQGIRPLRTMRASNHSKRSDCNHANRSGQTIHPERLSTPNKAGNRSNPSEPLKREGEEKKILKITPSSPTSAAGQESPPPSTSPARTTPQETQAMTPAQLDAYCADKTPEVAERIRKHYNNHIAAQERIAKDREPMTATEVDAIAAGMDPTAAAMFRRLAAAAGRGAEAARARGQEATRAKRRPEPPTKTAPGVATVGSREAAISDTSHSTEENGPASRGDYATEHNDH